MTLIHSWIADLQQALLGDNLTVGTVRVGVFYTAAQLSSGHVGVAFTPRDLSDTVCCPKTASSAPPSGRMAGRDVWEIANYAISAVPLRRSVGVATLIALSALAISLHSTPGGELRPGLDALDAAAIQRDDRVAMVGAFIPFIKALKGQVATLQIVDKHPEALKPEERSFWIQPERTAEVLSKATIAIISGSALVEGGIDELLEATARSRRIILAGPTASPWPPTFFRHGVDILGGIRVRNAERLLAIVSEGGSGYMFEEAAEKVSIVREATRDPEGACKPLAASTAQLKNCKPLAEQRGRLRLQNAADNDSVALYAPRVFYFGRVKSCLNSTPRMRQCTIPPIAVFTCGFVLRYSSASRWRWRWLF